MTKLKGFTQEFEDEAVRLARTSGRTRRETADNLGVGLSTLTRWIARSRDREIDFPDKGRAEDAAVELKRLRRENAVLRQERDILKKAAAFSPGREVDELQAHRSGESGVPHHASVPAARRQATSVYLL